MNIVEVVGTQRESWHQYRYNFVCWSNKNAYRSPELLYEYHEELRRMKEWCAERFGSMMPYRAGRWTVRAGIFDFREQDDAFEFKLRWA